MKILGIDYGSKRIGLALSDVSARFAFPYSVLKFTSSGNVNFEIQKICKENDVKEIVLGRPIGYKGDATEILKKIEKFKKELKEITGLPVIYENEVLTTQEAKRPSKAGQPRGKVSNYRGLTSIVLKKVDASAAAIILQSYLDHVRRG